jgi:hypothetical protein
MCKNNQFFQKNTFTELEKSVKVSIYKIKE